MTFDNLVRQIQIEARLKTDVTFVPLIVSLLNESFLEAVENQRPFELKKEIEISLNGVTNGRKELPADFLVHHEVLFKSLNLARVWPLSDEDDATQPNPRGLSGYPKSYEVIGGNQVYIKPFNTIVNTDSIYLIYYAKPPLVDVNNLVVQNTIIRLEPFLIRFTVRRLRMFHTDDPQVIQWLAGDIASAAQGYSKDEPQVKPESPTD